METVIVLLLIILNGVFAMSEIAIVSARRARLVQMANEDVRGARAALALAESPTRFLSTVQIGITLIGILAGAFGGATIAEQVAVYINQVPALAPYSAQLSLGLVVLTITYLSLVIGELVPKRLGLFNPERTAATIAGPMRVLSAITAPIVSVLSGSTELVLRLLGARAPDEPSITEEEISVMLQEGTQAGVFEAAEQNLIERVFRLNDRQVGSLATPRLEIVWLDLDDAPEVNQRKMAESPYSRFPVAKGSLEDVAGIASTKYLYARVLAGEPFDLTTDLALPLYVPASTPALELLERFKQSGVHLALVVDEYGSVEGLVTLTDILEAIVGDLPSAGEPHDPDIVRREDGSWLLDGMLTVEELKDTLGVRELPAEERGNYHTLAGFVLMQLGHIPAPGDHFEWNNFRFEVMDMDRRRIDKVLVVPQPAEEADGATAV